MGLCEECVFLHRYQQLYNCTDVLTIANVFAFVNSKVD